MAEERTAGRVMRIKYAGEPRLWQERLLVKETSKRTYRRIVGTEPDSDGPYWWALTPDSDLYPQEMTVPPLRGLAF